MIRLITTLVALLIGTVCLADGLIIIHNPPHPLPGHFAFAPLEVTYHKVDVQIKDDLAITTVDQEFRNSSSARLEGTYLFPLPPGAHIDQFSMDVNGKMMDAELLPADKARELYEEIVRKQRDPALLEYVGQGAFKVRIFPIEPNSTKQVKLRYTQLLKATDGLTEYVYPLNTEKFSSRPLKQVSVKVHIDSASPISTAYCPTHPVDVKRDSATSLTIGYEQRDVRPDSDFRVVFARQSGPLDIRVIPYARGGEDGYFLLMASPAINLTDDKVQPRDICFVVDTSGSMQGNKLRQAKKAVAFCLDSLNPTDRFQVVRFSTGTEPLFDSLRPVNDANLQKAKDFVSSFKATGGTDIHSALSDATNLASKRADAEARPYMIVVITDGQPTVGNTSLDAIVDVAKRSANTRIFCFGVGNDLNTTLLDRITETTSAYSTYVGDQEDLEVKVSSFYNAIRSPVLTDVTFAFAQGDVRAYDMLPQHSPDLFRGQTLQILGRYHGSGKTVVNITGTLMGESRRFTTTLTLPEQDGSQAYVPQLWATRRVGYLLDQIRLHGESEELKQEVTRLAREFGIVTPYTAYLILEDEQRRNVPVPMQTLSEMSNDSRVRGSVGSFYSSANAKSLQSMPAGEQAVINSKSTYALRSADNVQSMAAAPSQSALGKSAVKTDGGYRATNNFAQQVRMVNGRAFYQNANTWVDGNAQKVKNLKQQKIEFASAEYFDLLRHNPDTRAWFSLGQQVDVVVGDTLYQVR